MADEQSQKSHSEKTAEQSAQRGSHSEQQKNIDSTTAPKNREGNPSAGETAGGKK